MIQTLKGFIILCAIGWAFSGCSVDGQISDMTSEEEVLPPQETVQGLISGSAVNQVLAGGYRASASVGHPMGVIREKYQNYTFYGSLQGTIQSQALTTTIE